MKNYWLVKCEPASYSWDDLVAEGKTSWTSVCNVKARNNLRNVRVDAAHPPRLTNSVTG